MRSVRARAAAMLLVPLLACHAAAPKTSAPGRALDGSGGARKDKASQSPGDELDALQAELTAAHAELSGWQQGPAPIVTESQGSQGKTSQAEPADASEPQSRCERIAALADRICGLRDAMCLLAQEHEGEARYHDACGRAGQMCQEASEASDGCTDDDAAAR